MKRRQFIIYDEWGSFNESDWPPPPTFIYENRLSDIADKPLIVSFSELIDDIGAERGQ